MGNVADARMESGKMEQPTSCTNTDKMGITYES